MQENCELAYEELKSEIQELHSKAVAAVELDPVISNLLKGYKVFYSPLIYKPKVLFIGINPGNGEEGEFDCEHCDKGELEYLHYNYTLADETKMVFEMAGKSEALYYSVKTNYYYLATTSRNEIFKITDFLGRKSKDDLGEKLIVIARRWTKRLIEITEPELIICEGSEVYANVTDLFQESIKMSQDVEFVYVEEIEANIVGYKRTYSHINNKEKLAAVIATLVH